MVVWAVILFAFLILLTRVNLVVSGMVLLLLPAVAMLTTILVGASI